MKGDGLEERIRGNIIEYYSKLKKMGKTEEFNIAGDKWKLCLSDLLPEDYFGLDTGNEIVVTNGIFTTHINKKEETIEVSKHGITVYKGSCGLKALKEKMKEITNDKETGYNKGQHR